MSRRVPTDDPVHRSVAVPEVIPISSRLIVREREELTQLMITENTFNTIYGRGQWFFRHTCHNGTIRQRTCPNVVIICVSPFKGYGSPETILLFPCESEDAEEDLWVINLRSQRLCDYSPGYRASIEKGLSDPSK